MELKEAIELIAHESISGGSDPQVWADLGCGDGLFTQAISHLLKPGSKVYGIDKEKPKIAAGQNGIVIEARELDFVKEDLGLPALDGILMANSLHYVSDKNGLLVKLEHSMKKASSFLIVEYDTNIPVSNWVPYPLSFQSLQILFRKAGYETIIRIGKRASVYGRADLYSVLIRK